MVRDKRWRDVMVEGRRRGMREGNDWSEWRVNRAGKGEGGLGVVGRKGKEEWWENIREIWRGGDKEERLRGNEGQRVEGG